MTPMGDPYAETAALEDHRRDDLTALEIEDDELEGEQSPILLVVLRTAAGDTTVKARIDEPLTGVYRIEKQ